MPLRQAGALTGIRRIHNAVIFRVQPPPQDLHRDGFRISAARKSMKNHLRSTLTYRLTACIAAAPVFLFTGCAHQAIPSDLSRPATAEARSLPGVDLHFFDFFKLPVGARGLEPTDRLLSLAGKRVKLMGYMVKEEEPFLGLFMLAPMPVSLAELADGPSDYLPPATLFVHMPGETADKIVGYRPGTWTVAGTLELGGQEEENGRVSYVRLMLDDLSAVRTPEDQTPQLHEEGALVHHHRH
ncbi:MAG: hypothetical protein ACREWG_04445 [Gammaproteobacteria bacterium]